jgi:tellurite resistance protein
MALKELFKDDEWKTLKLSFAWAFNHVADADGKIDKKEIKAFEFFLSKAQNLHSLLAKEILPEISDYLSSDELRKSVAKKNKDGLREVATLIEKKLERKEIIEFKKTVIAMAYSIANASGSLFDHKISDDEEDAIKEIGFGLGMSVKEMISTGEIQEVLELIK